MNITFASSLAVEMMMPVYILLGMIVGCLLLNIAIRAMFRAAHGEYRNADRHRRYELTATLIAVGLLCLLIIGCQFSRVIAEWAL